MDQLQVNIYNDLWILSDDGNTFFFGKDQSDSIEVVTQLQILSSNVDVSSLLGSRFYFSSGHSYGIIEKNKSVYFFKHDVSDDSFMLIGQLIPNVSPY
jgi:hypothetical protein